MSTATTIATDFTRTMHAHHADEQEPLTDDAERDDEDDAAQAEINREWDNLYSLTARLDSERALHEELTAF